MRQCSHDRMSAAQQSAARPREHTAAGSRRRPPATAHEISQWTVPRRAPLMAAPFTSPSPRGQLSIPLTSEQRPGHLSSATWWGLMSSGTRVLARESTTHCGAAQDRHAPPAPRPPPTLPALHMPAHTTHACLVARYHGPRPAGHPPPLVTPRPWAQAVLIRVFVCSCAYTP